ncbi:MAG TPA: hypothetical protein VL691_10155 [Vicinamibacteria bacterium]|nr:hypothetical protein [Vicinamibacteria bacterium]
MSIARITTQIGYFGGVCALLALPGCDVTETTIRLPQGYRLVQKQQYQALYGPNGKIERLLQDRDHDGRADAVILYYPNGNPARGEIDTDGDGRVDRWEQFWTDGKLEKVDLDTNGDGKFDRTDYPQ